jgi:hypothetical protein
MRSSLSLTIRTLLVAAGVACCSSCGDTFEGVRFLAKSAHMGKWADKRPSGSIIMQDMLFLEAPRSIDPNRIPLGSFVVTTSGRMATKIDDVVSDRIPVNQGTKLNFAVGDAAEVRIEKAVGLGKLEPVSVARASFIEIIR